VFDDRKDAGRMRRFADDVVILETPAGFRAVAQSYRRWHDVSDAEVQEVLSGGR
jgi:predicted phosphoribosyltransferase